jgi:hypothetical protein
MAGMLHAWSLLQSRNQMKMQTPQFSLLLMQRAWLSVVTKRKYRLSALAVIWILTGCATTYHPIGSFATGGYAEIDGVTPDRVTATFDGDQWTKTQRAWDFALLRAGELCQQRGYSYLSIITKERGMTVVYEDFPGKAWMRPDGSAEGITSSETIEVNQPHAELEAQF